MFKLLLKKQVWGTFLIIAIGLLLYVVLKSIISKILLREQKTQTNKKRTTVVGLIQNITKYLILILIILCILDLYGVNVKAMLAGLGIITVVLGLALQDTLKDLIGGITIIFDDYYAMGDYINYNGFIGEVIEFGLRSTKIKSFSGEIKIFTNRSVSEVINYSKDKSILFIDIPVAYEEKVNKVEKVLNKIINQFNKEKSENISELQYLGIEKFDSSSMIYRLSLKCIYQNTFQAKRIINSIIKREFDNENIKIPYNQIEVHNAN